MKPVKWPPSVVSGDQLFFDTGSSTRGLSTGVTVGGTGSSLVQTTGEAAQRVHLPEVAVTIETLIFRAEFWTSTSPVQATGRVTSQPVMRDTGTSSASDCRLWSQNSSKGYRLNRITGCTELLVTYSRATGYRELPVPECCRFRNQSAAGYREICCSHHYWQGTSLKSSEDNSFTGYRGFPVTENWWWQVSWTGSFFSKIPLTNRLQSLPTECWFTQPSGTVASRDLEILVKYFGTDLCCPQIFGYRETPAYRFDRLQSLLVAEKSCWTTTVDRKKAASYEPIPAKN